MNILVTGTYGHKKKKKIVSSGIRDYLLATDIKNKAKTVAQHLKRILEPSIYTKN